jgi:hypothetical protein
MPQNSDSPIGCITKAGCAVRPNFGFPVYSLPGCEGWGNRYAKHLYSLLKVSLCCAGSITAGANMPSVDDGLGSHGMNLLPGTVHLSRTTDMRTP